MSEENIQGKKELKDSFFEIMEDGDISTVFQPIVSLRDGSVLGYEALSRGPANSELNSPTALFQCAEEYDRIWELETLCRLKAFESYRENNFEEDNLINGTTKLFLNVNPNIMNDGEYKKGFTKEYIDKFSLNSENIIFEITEHEAINNIDSFKKIITNYKNQEYQIAIDDAGAGYSGLNLISDIHPHYIKLDMNLIRDIDKDFTKQSLVRSLCDFAKQTETSLIAEGIETRDEMIKLIELGVNYGQGYYIQRPKDKIMPIGEEVKELIFEENARKNNLNRNSISDIYIENICVQQKAIHPNTSISQVSEIMEEDPSIQGFCIVEGEKLLGVITRNDLFFRLSGPYGYSLNARKEIYTIMSEDYLKVDVEMPIDKVANIAMQRDFYKLYDFITVTRDDKYYGIVTVKSLLEKTIEIEVVYAKHLNPLSELPGNLMIENELEKYIKSEEDYCVLYFDLNSFKAYNDVYGFEKGDLVLKKIAEILKLCIPRDEFIGHIGGDDFVAILSEKSCLNAEQICQQILDDFAEEVPKFYYQEDLEKGYITARNRSGEVTKFPPLSLSISGLRTGNYKDIYQLSEKSSELKKYCKSFGDNHYVIE